MPTPKPRRRSKSTTADQTPVVADATESKDAAPTALDVAALTTAPEVGSYAPPPMIPPAATTLTDAQRTIVLNTRQHLLVNAGAGSGKTRTLVEKIVHEAGYGNVPGERPAVELPISAIAAITFTRKAAGEIKERMREEFMRRARLAEGAERERWAEQTFRIDEARLGTLDSFAGRFVRDYGALAGVETGFSLLEAGEAEQLYEEVAEAALLDGVAAKAPGATVLVQHFGYLRSRRVVAGMLGQLGRLLPLVHRAETGRLSWEDAARKAGLTLTRVDRILEPHAVAMLRFLGDAARRLKERLAREGVLDHQGVLLTAATMASVPAVQAAFRADVRLLFVDEFQDTDPVQTELLFRLAGLGAAAAASLGADAPASTPALRLVLVGDPKQGIYGFRGADITMWEKARRRILANGGAEIHLADNHRSSPVLNRFFDDCLGRVLTPEPPLAETGYEVAYQPLTPKRPEAPGDGVTFLLADGIGSDAGAEVVAARIAHMLAHPHAFPVSVRRPDGTLATEPVRAKDIAILSRQLRTAGAAYETALQRHEIGCYVYGGRGLYAREEIQDLTILLRAVADPTDTFALLAYLRSPLGGVDDLTLAELAAVSSAAPSGTPRRSLHSALLDAAQIVSDATRAARAVQAAELLTLLTGLRDRLPHHQLLDVAIERTGYRAFLAGAPDAPAGVRNVTKLLKVARDAGRLPLFEFVQSLGAKVRRADREDEAPLYSPDDNLVTITTIHKAKGLEWPYVFVVGIDEPVVRKVGTEDPRLDDRFGLALPLDVVIRDEASEVPSPERSAVWAAHAERQMMREYAEAKRLFYVACTRAQDGLTLAGALTKDTKRERAPRQPRTLTNTDAGWLFMDKTDRWLRFCYPALCPGADVAAVVTFGPAGDVARVLRGLAEARPADEDRVGVGAATPARSWPAVPAGLASGTMPVPGAAAPAWPDAVAERVARLDQRATIRDEFTASELLAFTRCAWQHFWTYAQSISQPRLDLSSADGIITEIPPERRGDILHAYLRVHQDGWTPEQMTTGMRAAILHHFPMREGELAMAVPRFLDRARKFLEHPIADRVRRAERDDANNVLREVPFVHTLPNGTRLVGAFDLVFRDADGWHVVDFKDAAVNALEDPKAAVIAHAARYEVQAAVYGDAAHTAFAVDGGCRSVTLFFTALGEPHTIPVTDGWRATWRAAIVDIVERMRRGAYGDAPRYRPTPCDTCDVRFVCRPEGAPPELLQLTRASRTLPLAA